MISAYLCPLHKPYSHNPWYRKMGASYCRAHLTKESLSSPIDLSCALPNRAKADMHPKQSVSVKFVGRTRRSGTTYISHFTQNAYQQAGNGSRKGAKTQRILGTCDIRHRYSRRCLMCIRLQIAPGFLPVLCVFAPLRELCVGYFQPRLVSLSPGFFHLQSRRSHPSRRADFASAANHN